MGPALVRTAVWLGLLIFLITPLPVTAGAPATGPAAAKTFSLYFENDLFAGTDQSYTNGVKLTWISPDLTHYAQSPRLPRWSLALIDRIPFIHKPDLQRNVAVSLGQAMYTPADIARRDLIPDDRPYAGWTYLGVALHSKSRRRLDSMEIQMGMVGPLSMAEEAQKTVHALRNLKEPMGWDNQLENEPGLVAVYDRCYRLVQWHTGEGIGADLILHVGAALGNVAIYTDAGLEIRLGWNVPEDFGSSLIRPGQDTNAPAGIRDVRLAARPAFGCHLFGALNGQAVARDIFLDGNTFVPSQSVTKEPFVADLVAGVSLVWGRFKFSYAHARRTREFKTQPESEHNFGSLTISYSY